MLTMLVRRSEISDVSIVVVYIFFAARAPDIAQCQSVTVFRNDGGSDIMYDPPKGVCPTGASVDPYDYGKCNCPSGTSVFSWESDELQCLPTTVMNADYNFEEKDKASSSTSKTGVTTLLFTLDKHSRCANITLEALHVFDVTASGQGQWLEDWRTTIRSKIVPVIGAGAYGGPLRQLKITQDKTSAWNGLLLKQYFLCSSEGVSKKIVLKFPGARKYPIISSGFMNAFTTFVPSARPTISFSPSDVLYRTSSPSTSSTSSPSVSPKGSGGSWKTIVIAVVVPIAVLLIAGIIILTCLSRRKKSAYMTRKDTEPGGPNPYGRAPVASGPEEPYTGLKMEGTRHPLAPLHKGEPEPDYVHYDYIEDRAKKELHYEVESYEYAQKDAARTSSKSEPDMDFASVNGEKRSSYQHVNANRAAGTPLRGYEPPLVGSRPAVPTRVARAAHSVTKQPDGLQRKEHENLQTSESNSYLYVLSDAAQTACRMDSGDYTQIQAPVACDENDEDYMAPKLTLDSVD